MSMEVLVLHLVPLLMVLLALDTVLDTEDMVHPPSHHVVQGIMDLDIDMGVEDTVHKVSGTTAR